MLAAARIGAVVVPFSTFATARETARAAGRQRCRDPAERRVFPLPRLCAAAGRGRSADPDLDPAGCSPPPHRNCATSRSATAEARGGPRYRARYRLADRRPRAVAQRWKTMSTAAIRWPSSTRRARPAPPKEWCTHTPRCSDISRTSTQIRGLTRGGQAVLQFAVLLDRRVRVRPAGHLGRRVDAGVLQRSS